MLKDRYYSLSLAGEWAGACHQKNLETDLTNEKWGRRGGDSVLDRAQTSRKLERLETRSRVPSPMSYPLCRGCGILFLSPRRCARLTLSCRIRPASGRENVVGDVGETKHRWGHSTRPVRTLGRGNVCYSDYDDRATTKTVRGEDPRLASVIKILREKQQ